MPEKLYRVKDVMEYLSISRPTFYRLIRDGKLESIHIGRSVRIPASSLEAFISDQRQGGAA